MNLNIAHCFIKPDTPVYRKEVQGMLQFRFLCFVIPILIACFVSSVGLSQNTNRVGSSPSENSGEMKAAEEAAQNPHMIEATEKVISGNNEAAIQSFTEILEENPDDAAAFFNRGSVKILSQDYEGAIEDLTNASELYKEKGNEEMYNQAIRQIEMIKQFQQH